MSSAWAAGAAGVLAGLGVAVPLGAVGVLLVSEGMTRGWTAGARAAAGVATVDLVYAGVAAAAGAAVTATLAGREVPVRLLAAAVLAVVAVRGLLAARSLGAAAPAGQDDPAGRRTRIGPYWRFVAITAVNPMTALYFVALAAGLGDRLAGPARATAFVLGVGVGSLAWQLVLAGAGAGAGAAVGVRGRRWTAFAGNAVVLALAVAVAVSALTG